MLSRGWEKEFISELDAYVAGKEEEIRSVCDMHYEEVDICTVYINNQALNVVSIS